MLLPLQMRHAIPKGHAVQRHTADTTYSNELSSTWVMTSHEHLTVQTLSRQREGSGQARPSLMNKTRLPGCLQLNSDASSSWIMGPCQAELGG